jgi:predicted transcriptional regulator of viral defense system
MVKKSKPNRSDRLYTLAERQGGYFTAADAKAAGYDYPLQHFHVQRGNWIRVDRGTFRLKRFPSVDHDDLIRWWLWTRKLGVISHESAATVYDVGEILPAKVHLTVPPGFRKKTVGGVALHRAPLHAREVDVRDGFPVTTPLRTILDLAEARLDPDRLTAVVKAALRKGLVDRRAVLDVLATMPKHIDPSTQVTLQLAVRER